MTKRIKDELAEHHEGQRLFTVRRTIFAVILGAAIAGTIAWVVIGSFAHGDYHS